MSTYLELCQRAARECAASGTGNPTTVVGQIGQLARIVSWVAQALTEIESKHTDWGWMLQNASFPTIAAQGQYSLTDMGLTSAVFNIWHQYRFRNYPTTVGNIGEIEMDTIGYDDWFNCYSYGATRYTQSRPSEIAIYPDGEQLCLGPYPAAGYTITGQYFRKPQILVNDTDTPSLPVQFHDMLVFKAMMYYGFYESAPEVLQRGEEQYTKYLQRLEKLRLPPMSFA